MTFKTSYLTYRHVGEYVEDFLKKYHSSLKLPIPIEWIIESDLGLHIVPFPNLYKIFSQSGFLSADRTKIFIDEYQYDNFVEKYRFTLAHEIGHFIMHKSLYEGLPFNSEQEFIEYLQSRPTKGKHLSHEFCSYASNELAEPFEVNPVVVEIRIRQESFAEKFKDYYL
ncbi:MAG: hypothetical protein SRB1_01325 [Desulfobacteraceae bacterium Eth-SRB1]|nr:MAG: hypothetical protein SRB1_01325 [Desulfobacteraceae bacterium Eth-SRB1]